MSLGAVNDNASGNFRVQAKYSQRNLTASRTNQPGDAEHLTTANGKINVVKLSRRRKFFKPPIGYA